MRYYAVSLLILFSYFISVCEDTAADSNPIKKNNKVTAAQKKTTTEIKKEPVLDNPVRTIVNTKHSESSLKNNIKPPQLKIDENPVLTEQPQTKAVLDLSIPNKTKESIRLDNPSSDIKKKYLPDLFADKQEKNNSSLQLDGKIIEKEEQAVDKERTMDGAGVDIKITY